MCFCTKGLTSFLLWHRQGKSMKQPINGRRSSGAFVKEEQTIWTTYPVDRALSTPVRPLCINGYTFATF